MHDPLPSYPTDELGKVMYPDAMNRTGQVSSRLAKKESKRLARQTIFFFLIAIGLGLVFLFVIVPGVIRFATTWLDSSGAITEPSDTIPPQIPRLSAPAEATFSASLKLNGFGEAKSEVVVLNNETEVARVTISDEGTFEYALSLDTGDNSVSLYSVDEAGNESEQSQAYKIAFDASPPPIEIAEPEDGQTFETPKNQSITITGQTEPKSKVYLNDRLVFVQADGSFSTTYRLSDGENILNFKAVDQAENTSEKKLSVNFRY